MSPSLVGVKIQLLDLGIFGLKCQPNFCMRIFIYGLPLPHSPCGTRTPCHPTPHCPCNAPSCGALCQAKRRESWAILDDQFKIIIGVNPLLSLPGIASEPCHYPRPDTSINLPRCVGIICLNISLAFQPFKRRGCVSSFSFSKRLTPGMARPPFTISSGS